MIYRVFLDRWQPTLCPNWGIANKVSQDYSTINDSNGVLIEKDEAIDTLRLDFGGATWNKVKEVEMPLGKGLPNFTFFAHQLTQTFEMVKSNYKLVEETGYVKFYGYLHMICLSPKQAQTVYDDLNTNFDMYKIMGESSRLPLA